MSDSLAETTTNVAGLAALFGVTEYKIRNLIQSGHIPRAEERGQFPLADAIQGYCRHIEEVADRAKPGSADPGDTHWGRRGLQDIATVLGCSMRRLQQLAEEGNIPRPHKRGIGYDTAGVVTGFCDHLRGSGNRQTKSTEEIRLKGAQADRAELEVEIKRAELITKTDAGRVFLETAQEFIASLDGAAARICRALGGDGKTLRVIEGEHDRVKHGLADNIDRKADALTSEGQPSQSG